MDSLLHGARNLLVLPSKCGVGVKIRIVVSDYGHGRNQTVGVSRPPIVRTSRGRVQVLPSRFNDSVIDNWRKDSNSEHDEEIEECRKEKVKASSNHSFKIRQHEVKSCPKNQKYSSVLCKEEMVKYSHSFDMKNHMMSSHTTLTSLQEQHYIEEETCPKKEGVYGPEVHCYGCKVWIHAACDQISHKHFMDLAETYYYCPTCRTRFNFELSDSEKQDLKSKLGKNNAPMVLPDKVIVVCSGVEELYASVDLVDLKRKHLVNGKGILVRKPKTGRLVLKLKAPSWL